MKHLIPLSIFLVLLAGLNFNAFTDTTNSSGKAGYTGSPGETTCSSCHTGGSGQGNVLIAGVFSNNQYQYLSNQNYNMSVTVLKAGVTRFGFGLEALDTNNNSVGNFIPLTDCQTLTASNGRINLTHTSSGTFTSTTGTKTFNFTWQAPSSTTYSGKVKFYAVGNCTNNNNSDSGDIVFATSLSLDHIDAVGIEELSAFQQSKMYPSITKASEKVTLAFTYSGKNNHLVLRLRDYAGRELDQYAPEVVSGPNNLSYTLPSSISSGIYFIELLDTDGNRKSFKFVVD
jgi:hypothetical protein